MAAARGPGARYRSWQTVLLSSKWRSLLLMLIVIVAIELVNTVDAKTEFNGTYLSSLRALDLECTTDEEGSLSLHILAVNHSSTDATPKTLHENTPGVEIKADYPLHKKGRKLHLRRLNYKASRNEVTYTCSATKRDSKNGEVTTGEATHIHWIIAPPDLTTATTTTTTSVTSPVEQFTTILPDQDETEVAATVVNEEEPFSGVRLYVVVAISCVLVIVLVVFIMYYIRVRHARLRREKMEQERTMDWDDAPSHTANYNLANKSPASARIPLQHLQQESAAVCHSPACRTISPERATPSHTHPQIHGQIRPGEREPSPTREPLLTPHSHRDRRRSSMTSEDEEERNRRRDRYIMSNPRSRSREAVPSVRSPGHSRSYDPLEWTESNYEPYLRSYRYSFPRHSVDNTSDEESDYPGYRRRSRSAHRYPRRSLSQQSLNRHPRHRRRSSGRSPLPQYIPTEFFPSPDRQRYRDGQVQPMRLPDSNGQRYFQDGMEVCYPQSAFPQGMPAGGVTPLAVRVCEENNVVYSNRFVPSETDGEGSCMRESDAYQECEADRSGRTMSSSAAETHTLPGEHSRQSMHTEDVGAVCAGDPFRSRLDQPARTAPDAWYPSHSMPSRRRRHHSPSPRSRHNSSSALRHYNTASIPRPHERHPQGQIPHNRSFPQLYYVTQGGGPQLRLAPELEVQPATVQPQSQQSHRSCSVSQSAVDIVEDSSPHHHGRLAEGLIRDQSKHEVPELPSPVTAEAQRQMNRLSQDEAISSQDPTTALNVPVGNQLSALSMTATVQPHQDDTQRKTTMAGVQAHNSTARPPAQQQALPLPGPSQTRSRGAAAVSDSSPNSTPPGHRRSSLSSSEEDNMQPRARKCPQGKRGREINIHDIKTDHQTQCKRVESFKVSNNARPPVVCAADMANSRSGAENIQYQPGLQKRESARSSVSQCTGNSQRDRREAARSGTERGLEQFGVEVMSSYDPSCAGPCSHYTENNHSTVVKGFYPPQE